MAEEKAWAILGTLGGLYAIVSGIAIVIAGVGAANTINTLVLQAYISTVYHLEIIPFILQLIQYVSPTLAAFTFGPLAPLLGLQASSALSILGIIVIILGLLILLGAFGAMRGMAWGAILMAIFGFIGFLIFNLGGLLALIAGLVLYYKAK
ncbi:MAG: hypothetical protein QXS27_04655 [Candidatus Jordarchaeaceae archaeon]